ncbi:MAG: bifunctional homocysteine S-methyltransferase/methylenetetrahydrofolate reductase [Thermomicrobiales bacterium]
MSSHFETSSLSQRLATHRLLFDGPMGTALEHAGTLPGSLFESVNTTNPSLVKAIHAENVRAGCAILTTNTFAANSLALRRHGIDTSLRDLIAAGVLLAREASNERVLVAGSIGPVVRTEADGAGADPEVYREQIALLRDERVDLLTFESFESREAMRAALTAARLEAPDLPVIAHYRITASHDGGMTDWLERVAADAFELGADVFGLNCGLAPGGMYPFMRHLREVFPRKRLVAQPSIGPWQQTGGRYIQTSSPDAFATYGRRFLKLGIDILGSCCGTTTEHIRALSGAIRMNDAQADSVTFPARSGPTEGSGHVAEGGPHPPAVKLPRGGAFGSQLGQTFVTSVEINPPSSIDYRKAITAARRVLDGGATVINTTDGARASLRMDNLAFASILQQELDCEALLHVCGRDRSLLGTVSHLMAAHALGVRNLVLITGDPPKMGTFPSSSPVFDVDSLALLRIVDGLNRGIDPSGKEMDQPTSFLCGTGVEPAAADLSYEIDRLFRKKEAGADFVMTQPVYDDETLLRFLDAAKGINLPILMGVVPLASSRNAEFVNANVPGMRIPPHVLRRMERAGNGPEARREGVAIAIESLQHARTTGAIQGAYIVPPLGFYSSAVSIIEALSV